MKTSSLLSCVLIFIWSSAALAESKGDGRQVLSGAEANKEIEEFVTERWLKQRWQIEFDERKKWHIRGTDFQVILDGPGEAHDMKRLDTNKVYEFTGVPMDKRWTFIMFYVSARPKPVDMPETGKGAEKDSADQPATAPESKSGAEQGGADQPATAPESKSEGNEKPKPESDGRSQ
jgi:hypothetical protein